MPSTIDPWKPIREFALVIGFWLYLANISWDILTEFVPVSEVMAKRKSKSTKSTGRKPARAKASSKKASTKRSKTAKTGKPARTTKRKTGGRKGSGAKSKTPDGFQRLQRVMAQAGFGSRRECEQFIVEGRVEVDGKIVTELGTKVDPEKQKIYFDGQRLSVARKKYFILNKPPGVVSTSRDPSGRPRVIDLIKSDQRVYNVGRLDKSSEGLILVTNDGDLAHKLTHPRFGIAKRYLVKVKGHPEKEALESLKRGIYLAEGFAKVANITFKKRLKDSSWLQIVLEEGRNREIRRLLAKIGHKVVRLQRIAIGPVELGDLPLGAHRKLTYEELEDLRRAVSSSGIGKKRQTGKKKPIRGKSASRSNYSSRDAGGSSAAKSTGTKTSKKRGKVSGKDVWKTAKPKRGKSAKRTGGRSSTSKTSGGSKRGAARAGGLKRLKNSGTKKRGRR